MTAPAPTSLAVPSPAAARAAGLRYVSDEHPGFTRHRAGRAFTYRDVAGRTVRDPETLRRIRSLAIPPAWTEVWICPHEDGHIQATGRDARGRKQYRYHPRWREVRDAHEYERVLAFAAALPRIRRHVAADLRRRGLRREKVLATIVHLLETTLIRVGNDEYAAQNGSYGLTTMRDRHARVRGHRITFEFSGKSGKRHCIDVHDPELARLVRRCQELPGQELFAYVDETGATRDVTSSDVNDYLRAIAGEEFSAKDFRTWAGTVLAAIALREVAEFTSQRQAKRNIVRAIEAVAKMLGNTPSVCRRCYVHPVVLESYLTGQTIATMRQHADERLARSLRALRPEEAAVMMLLRERLVGAQGSGARKARGLARAKSKTGARAR